LAVKINGNLGAQQEIYPCFTYEMTTQTHVTVGINLFQRKPSKRHIENIQCDMQRPQK